MINTSAQPSKPRAAAVVVNGERRLLTAGMGGRAVVVTGLGYTYPGTERPVLAGLSLSAGSGLTAVTNSSGVATITTTGTAPMPGCDLVPLIHQPAPDVRWPRRP